MGETCGLKLVYNTYNDPDVCKICEDAAKKQRRYDKMARDIERWQREGNRPATIEKTYNEMQEVQEQLNALQARHVQKTSTL